MFLMDANLMMDGARCDVGAGSHDTCSVDGLRSWGDRWFKRRRVCLVRGWT